MGDGDRSADTSRHRAYLPSSFYLLVLGRLPTRRERRPECDIAVLVADLFEDVELWYPYYRLLEAGHTVDLVGCEKGTEHQGKKGTSVTTTAAASSVDPATYDAVVVPGGFSPDYMRRCQPMVDLVREVGEAGKPVAAICHGPWMLASAGLAQGKKSDLVPLDPNRPGQCRRRVGRRGGGSRRQRHHLPPARRPPAFMREVVAALDG
jgi:PfpI family intracellular protease